MSKAINQNSGKRHPDAKLFHLENDLRAAAKAMGALCKPQTIADNRRVYKMRAIDRKRSASAKDRRELAALEAAYEKADKRFNAAIDAAVRIARKIQTIKPRTLDGVMIQLRAALWDSATAYNYDHVATPKLVPNNYPNAIEPDVIVATFHNLARINAELKAQGRAA